MDEIEIARTALQNDWELVCSFDRSRDVVEWTLRNRSEPAVRARIHAEDAAVLLKIRDGV